MRVAAKGPDHAGLDDLYAIDFHTWQRWASGANHGKGTPANLALGGVWTAQRCNETLGVVLAFSLFGDPATSLLAGKCSARMPSCSSREATLSNPIWSCSCPSALGARPAPDAHDLPIALEAAFGLMGLDNFLPTLFFSEFVPVASPPAQILGHVVCDCKVVVTVVAALRGKYDWIKAETSETYTR